jgi:hypothetical protein
VRQHIVAPVFNVPTTTAKMNKLLLIVEESFQITGRGVVLQPDASPEIIGSKASSHAAAVLLVRPNGEEENLQATFYWEHFNVSTELLLEGFKTFQYVCVLRDGTKEQVPPGTQIWLLDEMASD